MASMDTNEQDEFLKDLRSTFFEPADETQDTVLGPQTPADDTQDTSLEPHTSDAVSITEQSLGASRRTRC